MVPEVTLAEAPTFVRATVKGKPDLEGALQAMRLIAEGAAPAVNLLIDIRPAPAFLNLVQVAEIVAEFDRLRLGSGRKVAVLTEEERFDNAQFFAVSRRGRGEDVQAFTSFEEAFDWLSL
jgi:hypothetical protein